MTSQEMGTDMEEVGEVGVVAVAGREALTKEHCHVRIPANHREEKLAEEEVVEEVAEEVQEDDGLSHQQLGEVLVVE